MARNNSYTPKFLVDKILTSRSSIEGERGGTRSLRTYKSYRGSNPNRGRCLHYAGTMPYLPVLDVLRSYLGIKEGEQESVIKETLNRKILGLDESLKSVIPPLSIKQLQR